MKTIQLLTVLLFALATASCGKDDTGGGGKGDPNDKSYNKKIDSYLSERYLWNDEYKSTGRDLGLSYTDDDNNFLTTTLLKMTTNDLDKKWNKDLNRYVIYSYINQKPKTRVSIQEETRGVNHNIKKEKKSGFGFVQLGAIPFSNTTNGVGFYVMAVYPGSPAEIAGFRRGTVISEVDGTMPNRANYQGIYRDIMLPGEGTSMSFKKNESGAQGQTLIAEQLFPNPVIYCKVVADKVGYLVYSSFDAAYDDELLAAIKQLEDAGVTDLVLDLRLNGGGHVISSNMLSTCIAGEKSRDKVFQYYRYNNDRMANPSKTTQQTGNAYDSGKNRFYEKFYYGNKYYGTDLTPYILGLQRLYILTSSSTASASELVINSLQGIDMPVTLIGQNTKGKNVGMEVNTFNDGSYSYELTPITFQGYNAQMETIDSFGIPIANGANEISEWKNNTLIDFGPSEPLLARALTLITGKTYRAAAPARNYVLDVVPEERIVLPEDPRRMSGMIVYSADAEE